MTSSDDHLAPVTPLFGARPSRSDSTQEGSPSERPPFRAGGRRSRSAEASRFPDADAAGVAAGEGWADVGFTGPDETPPSDTVEVISAPPRVDAPLPTYAAFAPREVPTIGLAAAPSAPRDDPEEEIGEVESTADAKARAENISLHALSRRGVSSQEMAKTLRSRDIPEEVVLEEVERLERVGLLNDVELAENLVQSKQDRKGLGKGAITAELRQRGLAQEAIESAIADIDDDEEQARATEWALKRAGQLRGLDQATAERRLSAFLLRRGYRSEVIRRALEEALPRGGARRGGVRFE